ncbi:MULTISPECIES: sensor histidine kinase [Actinomyces]|uniref:ATP-binding protein n=1 Tax=Actinomyces respiraculi TaxID=2744574 RepID=A0A7T0LJY8_9ACTO|nr:MULTISPECIES: ATP-binding protein [Actinomyces]QPL04563.1 ATP-binding protein [Actinomyces respiraculi]
MTSRSPTARSQVLWPELFLLRPVDDVGPQTRNLRRLVTTLVALAACSVTPFLAVDVRAMTSASGQQWYWLVLPVLVVPPVVAGIAGRMARRLDSRRAGAWARWSLLATLTLFALLCLTAGLHLLIPSDDWAEAGASRSHVLVTYLIVVAVAAVAALRPRAAVAYLLTLGAAISASYPVAVAWGARTVEILIYLTAALEDLSILAWLLIQAEQFDEEDARERALRLELATQASLTRSRQESNSFIHDHILSVLRAVPMLSGRAPDLRAAARETLASLHEARRPVPSRPSELAEALAHDASRFGSDVDLTTSLAADLPLPSDVAHALREAGGEALRNSIIHAGRGPVARSITLKATADTVTLRVADDGCGFDPTNAPRDRFGLRESVIAAMDGVGGCAEIDSQPGRGTAVTLSWRRDRADAERPVPGARTAPLALVSCMESPTARLLSGLIFLAYIVIACREVSVGSYASGQAVLLAVDIDAAAALMLVWSWPGHRLPGWASLAVVVMAASANALTMSQIALDGHPGYTSWSVGASTALSCALLVRSRPGSSWALLTLVTVTTTVWTVSTGRSLWVAVGISVGHIVSLAIWHLMARLSASLTARTARAQAVSAEIIARQHAQEIRRNTMRAHLDAVRSRVTPVLAAIAVGGALSEDLRTRARLLEAELRDELRAPAFTRTPVTTAARAARERGVDVTLLDDHSPVLLDTAAQRTAIEHAAAALQTATAGRALIRLLPPHQHPNLMTIMIDDGANPSLHTVTIPATESA